jgi:hypothetical protein
MSAITKRPFLPKITIKKNDASLYTYDPFVPTFDFRLVSATIRSPYDSQGGQYEMKIISGDATNSAMNTILNNIQEDNEVTVWVGKTSASLIKVFLGKIETIEIEEPNKNLMYVTISGPDWGSDVLKNLVVNNSWVQKKDVANQDLFDTADRRTTIGQITKDLMSEPGAYNLETNYRITATDLGVILTTGNYPDITNSYQVPQFEANAEKLDDKLTELDELGGTTHFVDADKTFFMKATEVISPSGILLTDDENDAVINPTYLGKVGFIAPGSKYIKTVENHKARLYGLGSNTFAKDTSQEVVTHSTSLAAAWYAQQFTPTKQDAYTIGIYVGYDSTPTIDLTMILVEDKAGLPTGSTLRTVSKSFTGITPTGAWVYFPIGEKLTVGNKYWIIMAGNFPGNTYKWFRNNVDSSPSTSATSTNGTSWALTTTPNRFSYSFIHHANVPIVAVYPTGITGSTKHLHDEVIRRLDLTDSVLMSYYLGTLYARLGKRKEIFRGRIYAPDQLLKPNQELRIRKQQSGKIVDSDNFVLGQVEYIFDSADGTSTGSLYIDVEAVKFSNYP